MIKTFPSVASSSRAGEDDDNGSICCDIYIDGDDGPQQPKAGSKSSLHVAAVLRGASQGDRPLPESPSKSSNSCWMLFLAISGVLALAIVIGVSVGVAKHKQHRPSVVLPGDAQSGQNALITISVPFGATARLESSPGRSLTCDTLFRDAQALEKFADYLETAHASRLLQYQVNEVVLTELMCNNMSYPVPAETFLVGTPSAAPAPAAAATAAASPSTVADAAAAKPPSSHRRRLAQQLPSGLSSSSSSTGGSTAGAAGSSSSSSSNDAEPLFVYVELEAKYRKQVDRVPSVSSQVEWIQRVSQAGAALAAQLLPEALIAQYGLSADTCEAVSEQQLNVEVLSSQVVYDAAAGAITAQHTGRKGYKGATVVTRTVVDPITGDALDSQTIQLPVVPHSLPELQPPALPATQPGSQDQEGASGDAASTPPQPTAAAGATLPSNQTQQQQQKPPKEQPQQQQPQQQPQQQQPQKRSPQQQKPQKKPPKTCVPCKLPNTAATTCFDGRCLVTRCAAGWEDCDGNPENGCEANVLEFFTDESHCGSCSKVCLAPLMCQKGRCADKAAAPAAPLAQPPPQPVGKKPSSPKPAPVKPPQEQPQQQQKPQAPTGGDKKKEEQEDKQQQKPQPGQTVQKPVVPPPTKEEPKKPGQTKPPGPATQTKAPQQTKPQVPPQQTKPTVPATQTKPAVPATQTKPQVPPEQTKPQTKPSPSPPTKPLIPPEPQKPLKPPPTPPVLPSTPPVKPPQEPETKPAPTKPPAGVVPVKPKPPVTPPVEPTKPTPVVYLREDFVRVSPEQGEVVLDVLGNDELSGTNPADVELSVVAQPTVGKVTVMPADGAKARPRLLFEQGKEKLEPGSELEVYYTAAVPGKPTPATATALLLGSAAPSDSSLANCSASTTAAVLGTPVKGLSRVDDAATRVTLPFAVRMYGQSYSSATISSNGFVSLGTSGASEPCNVDGSWPHAACLGTGPVLAPFWDDLLTDQVLTYHDTSLGAYVIQWTNVMSPHSQLPIGTFQAWLFPNGTVGYVYRDLYGTDQALGSGAVAGIRGPSTKSTSHVSLLKSKRLEDVGAGSDEHGSWLFSSSLDDSTGYVTLLGSHGRFLSPGMAVVSYPKVPTGTPGPFQAWGAAVSSSKPDKAGVWPLLLSPDAPPRPLLLPLVAEPVKGETRMVTVSWEMPQERSRVPHTATTFKLFLAADPYFSDILRRPSGSAFEPDIPTSSSSVDLEVSSRHAGTEVYAMLLACNTAACSRSCIGRFSL